MRSILANTLAAPALPAHGVASLTRRTGAPVTRLTPGKREHAAGAF
jgi:hypothetical protein